MPTHIAAAQRRPTPPSSFLADAMAIATTATTATVPTRIVTALVESPNLRSRGRLI
jgi:hypothetical protein